MSFDRYSYYFLSSVGLRPGKAFKMLITNGQIVQFIFRHAQFGCSPLAPRSLARRSLVASVPFLYLHFNKPGGCSGFAAWCFNVCFNVLLLFLFRSFHRTTYAAKSPKAAKLA